MHIRSQRQRVIAALDYFDEKGWIELQPKSSVEVFEVVTPDFNPAEITGWLSGLFAARESGEIRRIDRMITLFEAPTCLAVALSAYFGEELDRECGVCSPCLSDTPIRLPGADAPVLDGLDFNTMVNPFFDKFDPPVSATHVARFLCGISTPALAKIRARAIKGFGCLSTYRYTLVHKWVTDQMTGNWKDK